MYWLLADTPLPARLCDYTPQQLAARGIRALALDFDGVLAPHGADQPLPVMVAWLQQATKVFGEERVVILSNRPVGPRVVWFAEQFPGVRFISGVRKKPYPDGLIQTGELTATPLSAILMADDRLLTGCLAALCAGAVPCYVRHPYICMSGNAGKELFFALLRCAERIFVRLLP